MAIQFPDLNAAQYDNANWLDNVDSVSWSGWVSWDTIDVGNRQYAWGHRGAVDRSSFRKNNAATEYARWSLTAGGVNVTVDDTITPVAGTVYHFVLTWEANSATGMKLYRNGSLINTSSTTTQTANYNSGGNVDLYIGCYSNNNAFGKITGEGFIYWPGVVLDADQAARLYYEGWPHLAQCPKPAALYELNGSSLTRIPDSSGNSRHIESAFIDSGVVDAGRVGKWEDPSSETAGFYRQGAAGPSPPNSWTLIETVTHPTNTSTATSLSNGTTYEFMVTALDDSGNESVESAIVEATPFAVNSTHAEREILLWHTPDLQAASGVGRMHICGFETGTDNEINRILRNAEISTTVKRTGTRSLRVYPDGSGSPITDVGYCQFQWVDAYGAEAEDFAVDTMYSRAYVYVESLPSADDEPISRIDDVSAFLKCEMRIVSDGTIALYDKDLSIIDTTTTALIPYNWYRVELMVGKGTVAPYELRIDGVNELSGFADLRNTQTGMVIWGKYNNRNSEAYEIFFDDCACDKLNWPGAGAVHVLVPDANGTDTGWTASAGNKYDCIDEIPVLVDAGGDTDYIYSTTLSDAYTCAFESRADVGITGDVLCVKAIGFSRKVPVGTVNTQFRVRSGSAVLDTTSDVLSQSEYESFIQFMPADPADGLAWTGAAVDALEAGFVRDASTNEQRVTQMCLLVEERE
jgi:hypothetical protein